MTIKLLFPLLNFPFRSLKKFELVYVLLHFSFGVFDERPEVVDIDLLEWLECHRQDLHRLREVVASAFRKNPSDLDKTVQPWIWRLLDRLALFRTRPAPNRCV